jgi:hypothetical protein
MSVSHRLHKAERHLGSTRKNILKPVPWSEKIWAWTQGPVAGALRNAVGWHLSADLLPQMPRWEADMRRSFMRLLRKPDEGPHTFHQRANERIRQAVSFVRRSMMLHRLIRAHHRWVHLAMRWSWTGYDGQDVFLLRELMRARLPRDWPLQQAIVLTMGRAKAIGWRRRRQGSFSDWSAALAAVCRENWVDFASSRSPQDRVATQNSSKGNCNSFGSWLAFQRLRCHLELRMEQIKTDLRIQP